MNKPSTVEELLTALQSMNDYLVRQDKDIQAVASRMGELEMRLQKMEEKVSGKHYE